MADRIERLKWRIASLIGMSRRQCWSNLVDWVLNDEPIRDTGVRAALPWRPIGEDCRRDAESAGRCYCGKLGSDGVVLGRNESVCVTRMPGREDDRLCSRPDGHDGAHRCGEIEWGKAGPDWGNRVDCPHGCDVSAMSPAALDHHVAQDHQGGDGRG